MSSVLGAPQHELSRSPAAKRIGDLAQGSQLFLFDYERRHHLDPPEAWLPADRPDLEATSSWEAGSLVEPKYMSFRHDLLVGSFHPGHRAKWTTHELCHGLVGFYWSPEATDLSLALGARLAEALPVALWYFLDEAGLQRCAAHAGDGPLLSAFCPAYEAAARAGARAVDEEDERWLREGRAFLERELERIASSREQGRPISHRLGSLDLSSDGLA